MKALPKRSCHVVYPRKQLKRWEKGLLFPLCENKPFILKTLLSGHRSINLQRGLAKGSTVAAGKAKWEVASTGAILHHYLERSLVVRVENSEIAVLNAVLSCYLSMLAPGHFNNFINIISSFPITVFEGTVSLMEHFWTVLWEWSGFCAPPEPVRFCSHMVLDNVFAYCSKLGFLILWSPVPQN